MQVSELEKVKIVPWPDETREGRAPDRDDFVLWKLERSPFGCESRHLEYEVKRDKKIAGI